MFFNREYNKFYALIIILLVASIPYLNSITNDFVWDDIDLIKNNPDIREFGNLPELFVSPFGHPVQYSKNLLFYRPVVFASYMVGYKLYGLNPAGYHLSNLLFHIASSVLVFVILLKVFSDVPLSLFSALIFALHPIHTESVSWISGRTDLLCTLFFLLSLNSYLDSTKANGRGSQYHYLLSIFFFSLSIFSKEMGMMLPAVIFCLELSVLRDKKIYKLRIKHCLNRYVPFLFSIIIYLVLRSIALKGNIYYSSSGDSFLQRILPMFNTFSDYAHLLLFPFNQNTLYIVKMPSSFFEAKILLSLLFFLMMFLSVLKVKQNRKKYLFGILWFFITLIPVSNIIPFSTIVKAEHFLYLPSIGFSIAVGTFLVFYMRKYSALREVCSFLVIIIIAFGFLTYRRNMVWKNEITLFSDQILKSPLSAIAHNNLGLAYKANKQLEAAKKEFITAKSLNPKMQESYVNLGNVFFDEDNVQSAMEEYVKAVKINASDAYVHNNLGVCFAKAGDVKKAMDEFKKASHLNSLYPSPYINLGNAYANMKLFNKAEGALKKAIAIDPIADNSSHFILGMVYRDLGEYEKAVEEFKKAININEKNVRAYIQMANLYSTAGDFKNGVYYYKKALALEPDNPDLRHKVDLFRKKADENR